MWRRSFRERRGVRLPAASDAEMHSRPSASRTASAAARYVDRFSVSSFRSRFRLQIREAGMYSSSQRTYYGPRGPRAPPTSAGRSRPSCHPPPGPGADCATVANSQGDACSAADTPGLRTVASAPRSVRRKDVPPREPRAVLLTAPGGQRSNLRPQTRTEGGLRECLAPLRRLPMSSVIRGWVLRGSAVGASGCTA